MTDKLGRDVSIGDRVVFSTRAADASDVRTGLVKATETDQRYWKVREVLVVLCDQTGHLSRRLPEAVVSMGAA